MLKKIFLFVQGLVAMGFAAAGTMGTVCTPGNMSVPCDVKRWNLGVQALYLRSVYNADKAYQHDSASFNGYREVKNEWDWGYSLEGSYHFNTGNDMTVTWMHYEGDANQGGFVGRIPINPQLPLFSSTYTIVSKNQLDQVNMMMGQQVDLGMVDKIRFYGGLQYAAIRVDATNYYDQSSPILVRSGIKEVSQFDNTDFKGLGPVIGIDYAYDLTNALSLTANGAGSILYGSGRFSNGLVGVPVNVVFASRYGSKKSMVPSFEAKLGLNYAYSMTQGVLNLAGGYQVVNYFNALHATGVAGILGTGITDSDFGLYGPYLGVKYVGSA